MAEEEVVFERTMEMFPPITASDLQPRAKSTPQEPEPYSSKHECLELILLPPLVLAGGALLLWMLAARGSFQ